MPSYAQETGVIKVGTLAKIRRLYFRDKQSIKEICRQTGMSRNTVRSWLLDPEMVEPKYPARVVVSKLDAYSETLSLWLKADSGRGKRERRTKGQMCQALCELGYTGNYGRVCAFARLWRIQQGLAAAKGAFIPLKFISCKTESIHSRWVCRALTDELHPGVRKRLVGRAPHVQHSLELKNSAVIELCTRTTSAQEIAEKVSVCRPTLYNWKNQLLGREAPASMKPSKDSESVPENTQLTELQQQVDLLQRNIRRLQLEHDLLKKANELLKKAWASPRSS